MSFDKRNKNHCQNRH